MAVPMGMGDDQDPDKFETALEEWLPPLWAGDNFFENIAYC